jgi:GcrA cell cycle regulator
MSRRDIWTADLVRKLKALLKNGLSAREVATKLGHGITRNAVLGKALRLRQAGEKIASGDSKPVPRKTAEAVMARRNHRLHFGLSASAPTVPIPPVEIKLTDYDAVDPSTPGLLRIMDLRDHHCRWPLNNALGGEYYFCGKNAKRPAPYCEAHMGVAYTKLRGAAEETNEKGRAAR